LELKHHGIHDAALARLIRLAEAQLSAEADCGASPAPVYPSSFSSHSSSKE
jgi:cation transport protein ChaC